MGIIPIKVELKYTNIVKKNNNQDIYIYIYIMSKKIYQAYINQMTGCSY